MTSLTPELKAYLDEWRAEIKLMRDKLCDDLRRPLTGLAAPPPPAPATTTPLVVAPTVPINNRAVVTTPCVTAPGASSDKADVALASIGLAEPATLVSTIGEPLPGAPAAPSHTIAGLPATCSTDCAAHDVTELTTTTLLPWTKLAPNNDNGEHGASLSSVSAVPFYVAPATSLTAVIHEDLTPSTKLVVSTSTTPTFPVSIGDTPLYSSWHHEQMNCPTQWPPPYLYLSWCDSSRPRPIPWPSFAILPGGVHLIEPRPPPVSQLQGTSGEFSVDVTMMHYFLDSQSWVSHLHISLHYELDRGEDFTSLQHNDRDDQFISLSVSLNVLEIFRKKACAESEEATVSGLISKGAASVFKLRMAESIGKCEGRTACLILQWLLHDIGWCDSNKPRPRPPALVLIVLQHMIEETPPQVIFKKGTGSLCVQWKPPWPSFRLVGSGGAVSHPILERFKQYTHNGPMEATFSVPESHMPQSQLVDIPMHQGSAFLDPSFGPESCTTGIPIHISDICSVLKIVWSIAAPSLLTADFLQGMLNEKPHSNIIMVPWKGGSRMPNTSFLNYMRSTTCVFHSSAQFGWKVAEPFYHQSNYCSAALIGLQMSVTYEAHKNHIYMKFPCSNHCQEQTKLKRWLVNDFSEDETVAALFIHETILASMWVRNISISLLHKCMISDHWLAHRYSLAYFQWELSDCLAACVALQFSVGNYILVGVTVLLLCMELWVSIVTRMGTYVEEGVHSHEEAMKVNSETNLLTLGSHVRQQVGGCLLWTCSEAKQYTSCNRLLPECMQNEATCVLLMVHHSWLRSVILGVQRLRLAEAYSLLDDIEHSKSTRSSETPILTFLQVTAGIGIELSIQLATFMLICSRHSMALLNGGQQGYFHKLYVDLPSVLQPMQDTKLRWDPCIRGLLSFSGVDCDQVLRHCQHNDSSEIKRSRLLWIQDGSARCQWFSSCDDQAPFQGVRRMPALGRYKELRVPWDPGGAAAAWGQAAFQEGRDVRDLSYTPSWAWAWLIPIMGLGPIGNQRKELQVLQMPPQGNYPSWIRRNGGGSFLPPRLFLSISIHAVHLVSRLSTKFL